MTLRACPRCEGLVSLHADGTWRHSALIMRLFGKRCLAVLV